MPLRIGSHPLRSSTVKNLAQCLHRLVEIRSDDAPEAELGWAIELNQECTVLTSDNATMQLNYLINVGDCIATKFRRDRNPQTLVQAVECYEKARNVVPNLKGHWRHTHLLTALATGLSDLLSHPQSPSYPSG